ncbi:hypothetical protein TNCV_2012421 [Trichonephila clavipes]|nr:hypothetical protein TNCV_2012421 [Trichonephila clavipes]
MDLIRGGEEVKSYERLVSHHAKFYREALAMSRKKYTRGLVLGKATVNQLRYSEQLVNCRALGSKTALLRNNKIKSSAVLIQTLQKHELVYFAQTRK